MIADFRLNTTPKRVVIIKFYRKRVTIIKLYRTNLALLPSFRVCESENARPPIPDFDQEERLRNF